MHFSRTFSRSCSALDFFNSFFCFDFDFDFDFIKIGFVFIPEANNTSYSYAIEDLGGISLGSSGLIFIYDGTIGGNGASRTLYDKFEYALERSLRILTECSCKTESGCPRCTFSYRCGNNNEYLHKIAAIEVLKRVSEREETHIEDTLHMDRPLV